MSEQKLVISSDGRMRFIWSDDLMDLLALGASEVCRASNVDPLPDGSAWTVDLSPTTGHPLAMSGFPSRADALAAEVGWLETRMVMEKSA